MSFNSLPAANTSIPALPQACLLMAAGHECAPPVACVPRGGLPGCGLVSTKTYAEVLQAPARGGAPPADRRAGGAVMGRPKVELPFSQLVLGKTTPPWNAQSWSTKTCKIVDGVLRVSYPEGSSTPSSKGPRGGCSFKARPHCLPATDVTLSYRVRFADNFDWVRGGKLPGLFIGHGHASGGDHSAGAASCRLMWLAKGKVIAYVYTPSGIRQSASYAHEVHEGKQYGDSLFHDAKLFLKKGGAWNDIILRVRVNGFTEEGDPKPDGVVTLSVNGQAVTFTGIVWRRKPSIKIDHVAVVTFFGGHWKSKTDTHADFADFSIVA